MHSRLKARLRKNIIGFLPQRCTIFALRSGKNQYGGKAASRVLIQEDIPCRLNEMTAADAAKMVGAQETLRDTYTLIAVDYAQITTNTQVEIDGLTYDVLAVADRTTDRITIKATITRTRTAENVKNG